MRSLNTWIEAQLKRGYSRKQIKEVLAKKGYSPKVVAEVDKIRYSASARTLPSKKIPKKVSYSLIFIFAIIAITVISVGYFIWLDKEAEEKPKPEALSALSQAEPKFIEELCKDYPKALNETPCIIAAKIALEINPGNISSIRRVALPENEIIWVVEMHTEPIGEKVNIIIDAKTSEIISTRPMP